MVFIMLFYIIVFYYSAMVCIFNCRINAVNCTVVVVVVTDGGAGGYFCCYFCHCCYHPNLLVLTLL